jgi:hypothetical protein
LETQSQSLYLEVLDQEAQVLLGVQDLVEPQVKPEALDLLVLLEHRGLAELWDTLELFMNL